MINHVLWRTFLTKILHWCERDDVDGEIIIRFLVFFPPQYYYLYSDTYFFFFLWYNFSFKSTLCHEENLNNNASTIDNIKHNSYSRKYIYIYIFCMYIKRNALFSKRNALPKNRCSRIFVFFFFFFRHRFSPFFFVCCISFREKGKR